MVLKADCVRLIRSLPSLGTRFFLNSPREVVGKSRVVGSTRIGPQRVTGICGPRIRVGCRGSPDVPGGSLMYGCMDSQARIELVLVECCAMPCHIFRVLMATSFARPAFGEVVLF